MDAQLLSDATSPINCNGSHPEMNTAGSTEFVLVCGCGQPAEYVVNPDIPGKRRSVCREVHFHILTVDLFPLAFVHVILVAKFRVWRREHAIMTYS